MPEFYNYLALNKQYCIIVANKQKDNEKWNKKSHLPILKLVTKPK